MKNKYTNYVICLLLLLSGLLTACDDDDDEAGLDTELEFNGVGLLGTNERPVVMSEGAGEMDAVFNELNNTLSYTITWQLGNPNDATTAMHFHGPANRDSSAPPIIDIEEGFNQGASGTISGTTRPLTQAEEKDLKAGLWYVNIHSTSHPTGELRGNLIP
ncbi:CHRD domain-containing protein [Pontibacter litorisediminis]|uniref:CHRD domain-containing protein n=1 Tax=Pontibacter litorisediminis TaxID=1846260 RepID=UPI0023EBFFF9|nr:CHRD domain-containing protein [Pontibacter litorisediminis]